jgi:hypothetical protein
MAALMRNVPFARDNSAIGAFFLERWQIYVAILRQNPVILSFSQVDGGITQKYFVNITQYFVVVP